MKAVAALVWPAVGAAAGLFSRVRSLALAGDEALREQERRGHWEGHEGRRPWAWIHGASVGEAEMAVALAAGLADRQPGLGVVVTSGTATGLARARLRAAGRSRIETRAFPIDYRPYVERIIRLGPPRLFVAVETELWPATLGVLLGAGVPLAVCNARMSERSAGRYRLASGLFGPLLAGLSAVMARDEESRRRWVEAGARDEATVVAGNLKFDLAIGCKSQTITGLFAAPGLPPVLLAASTHAGEEAAVARAFAELRRDGVEARLLVAPRHPERAGEAEAALRAAGLGTARLADGPAPLPWPSAAEAVVVGRLGLLDQCYAAAAAAFVGGSLVDGPGGHNLVEAAAAGVPLATGPHVANVEDQVALLSRAAAVTTVRDAKELARFWRQVLKEPHEFMSSSRRAREVLETAGGALARNLDRLEELLDGRPSAPGGRP